MRVESVETITKKTEFYMSKPPNLRDTGKRKATKRTDAGRVKASSGASGEGGRKAILIEAARLFSLYGYAGTTMADIADAVGIRSPSLYYHFDNKARIIEAIVNYPLNFAFEDSQRIVSEKTLSTPVQLYLLVRNVVYYLCESEYELYCVFDPVLSDKRFDVVNAKLIAWLKNIEKLVLAGEKEGIFSHQPSRVSTYVVRGLMEAAIRGNSGYAHMASDETARHVALFAVKGLLADHVDAAALRNEIDEQAPVQEILMPLRTVQPARSAR